MRGAASGHQILSKLNRPHYITFKMSVDWTIIQLSELKTPC